MYRFFYNYITMKRQSLGIQLTPTEQKIFTTLLNYNQQLGLKTVMRVAGGWVRDKIMGWNSNDIDIALDNMKGEQFVLKLKSISELKNQKISGFGVTKLNPDLSKHLQTATAKIHDQFIDFVNLRSEVYNEDSRIPTIEIGTPLEDAYRRDFTINSLFYNINTDQIEDWTKLGLVDMKNKIIRTPLEPLVTFKDDPLRVLRCFRFKSRFNFIIDESIYKSLENQGVHEALKTKVSKQRIGIELSGILKAQYPLIALEDILKYQFWNIIFEVPEQASLKDPETIKKIPEYSYLLIKLGLQILQKNQLLTLKELILNENQHNINKKKVQYSEEELRILINLSFLVIVYKNHTIKVGKTSTSLIDHIVRNQLKYSAKYAKFCQRMSQVVTQLEILLSSQISQDIFHVKIIKWLRFAQQKWEIAIYILSTILEVSPNQKIKINPFDLRQFVFKNRYENSYLIQSFIDGNFLLKKGKKGPIIKTILENTIIWRILHQSATKEQFELELEKQIQFFENPKTYSQ